MAENSCESDWASDDEEEEEDSGEGVEAMEKQDSLDEEEEVGGWVGAGTVLCEWSVPVLPFTRSSSVLSFHICISPSAPPVERRTPASTERPRTTTTLLLLLLPRGAQGQTTRGASTVRQVIQSAKGQPGRLIAAPHTER